jgi:biotin operon repressor
MGKKLAYLRISAAIMATKDTNAIQKMLLGLAESLPNGLKLSNGELSKFLGIDRRNVIRNIQKLRKKEYLIDEGADEQHRILRVDSDKLPPVSSDDMPLPNSGKMPPGSGASVTKVVAPASPISNNKYNTKFSMEFMNFWNSHQTLPKIHTFTKQRKRTLITRIKEPAFADNWKLIIDKLTRSPFHTGQNDRNWRATVDWLLKGGNYVKILEIPEDSSAMASTRDVSEEEAAKLMEEVEA